MIRVDQIPLIRGHGGQSTENGTGHDGSGFSPTNDGTYQSFVIDLTDRTLHLSDGRTLPVSLTGTYRSLSFA